MLKAGIQHHVDEEEKEILPELKSDLERQEWMAIGDRIVQLKEQAGQRPPASASTRRSSRHTTARKT
jgi:hemerythrin-like domain-containing protein